MSQNNMIRWIEDAEARRFYESVMSDRVMGITESQYIHLGDAVAKALSWTRLSINRSALASLSSQALEFARHPLSREQH